MWLLKKLHTYAGLLTFVNLAVYGIVGLSIVWLRQQEQPAPVVSYQNFAVGPNLTDRQVAEQICAQLHLSLATPVQQFAIQHDSANNLLLDFRHANGRDRVTVLEPERRIQIETSRNNLGIYFYILHETTGVFHSGDWRMQLWADYNEFAMWSFGRDDRQRLCYVPGVAMGQCAGADFAGHGVLRVCGAVFLDSIAMYQKLRSLHLATALFSMIFLLAFEFSAVELAHRTWFSHPHHSTTETRQMAPGITDARILAREWRGELGDIENSPGFLKFRVMTSLGTSHEVAYSIATGVATIVTNTVVIGTQMAFVHVAHGIWAAVAGMVSIALLLLGISGIYLWFKNHKERWIGVALLVGGATFSIGLIVSMRQG